MRISIIVAIFMFLIAKIEAKSVIHVDLEDYFKEYPIESSTEKHYFRAPAWTGGCMRFVFKVYKPHPEFKLEFQLVDVFENSTDDDIINSQKWSLTRDYSMKYSTDDYDIYYYHQNYPIGYKGDVGIFFSSDEDYKMSFSVKGIGYFFPINSIEETIVEDFDCSHYFNITVVGDGYKDISFVMRVYKPMDKYDFGYFGSAYYEKSEKTPKKLNFQSYRIKEGEDYIQFSYSFNIDPDVKAIIIGLTSTQHYKLGFYVVYDKIFSLHDESD